MKAFLSPDQAFEIEEEGNFQGCPGKGQLCCKLLASGSRGRGQHFGNIQRVKFKRKSIKIGNIIQGGIKCGNRGTGILDSEGPHRQQRPQTYAVLSRKRAITTFLSGKFMITRSSIVFENFLSSSIAPQVMPPCFFPQTLVPNLTYQQILLKLDIRLTRTPPGSESSHAM